MKTKRSIQIKNDSIHAQKRKQRDQSLRVLITSNG